MRRIPIKQPNPWKEDSGDKKRRELPPQYDSLAAENTIPCVSSYPETRHPRFSPDAFNAAKRLNQVPADPFRDWPFPDGKPSDEYDKYQDKDLVRLVDNIDRAWFVLGRIINEPLSQELLHYYVYVPLPCQQQFQTLYRSEVRRESLTDGRFGLTASVGQIETSGRNMQKGLTSVNLYRSDVFMNLIITDLSYRNPTLGKQMEEICQEVVRQAVENDNYFARLSALTPGYWNERNYEAPINKFKACLRKLWKRLNHVGQLLQKDLAAEKPAETKQDIAPSKLRRIIARLKNHPHSYGLTGGVLFLIVFLVLALFVPEWRSWCGGPAVIALLVLILSLLGGRAADNHVN